MNRITLAAAAAASILLVSTSAFAQMGAGKMEAGDMPTTCQGMMDKAHPKMDSMSDSKGKMMAMKQMDMAKTSMAADHEKSCMSHMKMAMHGMK